MNRRIAALSREALIGNHLTLGGEASIARPGTWARMPAHLPHSLFARSALAMALYLLPPGVGFHHELRGCRADWH